MDEVKRKIFGVSEIDALVRRLLESNFGGVWVEGEISGMKESSSGGHLYFALKDSSAVINCALFSGNRANVPQSAKLENGQNIRVFGEITFYPPSGTCQLIVRRVEPVGLGDLMRKFLELKKKLEDEGLFRAETKPPLPKFARRIGVVTSPTGAVIHDILTVIDRRFPNVQVRLAPVKVQGAGAAHSIAAAVRFFNEHYGKDSGWPADLLIVGRGGGSMEDLWCFNEEEVVRAVASSKIPVISSVGHETDTTLCDFAATRRAATPSVAAELAVPLKSELQRAVEKQARSLDALVSGKVENLRTRFLSASNSPSLKHPERILEQYAQKVDLLESKLAHLRTGLTARLRERISALASRIEIERGKFVAELRSRIARDGELCGKALARDLERRRHELATLGEKLRLLGPNDILKRGYSLTKTEDGRILRSVRDAPAGTCLETVLSDGSVYSVSR